MAEASRRERKRRAADLCGRVAEIMEAGESVSAAIEAETRDRFFPLLARPRSARFLRSPKRRRAAIAEGRGQRVQAESSEERRDERARENPALSRRCWGRGAPIINYDLLRRQRLRATDYLTVMSARHNYIYISLVMEFRPRSFREHWILGGWRIYRGFGECVVSGGASVTVR